MEPTPSPTGPTPSPTPSPCVCREYEIGAVLNDWSVGFVACNGTTHYTSNVGGYFNRVCACSVFAISGEPVIRFPDNPILNC